MQLLNKCLLDFVVLEFLDLREPSAARYKNFFK